MSDGAWIPPRGTRLRGRDNADGLAYARAWRERMRPVFDALFGVSA